VDDTAEAVQEGVDQAADVAQEVTDQVADGEFQHLAAYPVYNQITYTSKTLLDKQDMLPMYKRSTNSPL
jgi:hypothetical protein